MKFNLKTLITSPGQYKIHVGLETGQHDNYISPEKVSIDYAVYGKLAAPQILPVSLDMLKVVSADAAASKCRVYLNGVYADLTVDVINKEALIDLNKLTLPEEDYTIGVDLIAASELVTPSDITTITSLQIMLAPTAIPDTPVVTTSADSHGWIITDTSSYLNLAREYVLEDTNGNELASHPSVWGGVKEA